MLDLGVCLRTILSSLASPLPLILLFSLTNPPPNAVTLSRFIFDSLSLSLFGSFKQNWIIISTFFFLYCQFSQAKMGSANKIETELYIAVIVFWWILVWWNFVIIDLWELGGSSIKGSSCLIHTRWERTKFPMPVCCSAFESFVITVFYIKIYRLKRIFLPLKYKYKI